MAKIFLLAVVAIVALQGCTGKAVEKSQLETLAENAKTVVENVTQTLGLQDLNSKKVVKAINDQTQNLANTVQSIVDKLKGEVSAHQGEIDTVVKQVEKKLAETATALQQAAGPEATAKGQELKTKFDEGLKSAVAEIDKLVKSVQPGVTDTQNNLKNLAKTALDQFVEIGKTIQTQVNTAVSAHEKTHKH